MADCRTDPPSIDTPDCHPSSSWRSLTDEARTNLCAALCRNIQTYKRILYRAVNLDLEQVRKSIEEVVEACPEETFGVRECGEGRGDLEWPKVFGNSSTEGWDVFDGLRVSGVVG